jgi:hypothetical protein
MNQFYKAILFLKHNEFKKTNGEELKNSSILSSFNTVVMEKSNIFVRIELSKFVGYLSKDVSLSKQQLKSQAGYFNIVLPKYFSDALSPEWENIISQVKDKGPKLDEAGRVVSHAIANTIDHMSTQECLEIVLRIMALYEKVKLEFE